MCVNVTIVDDDSFEIEEYFSATLTGDLPPGAVFNITSTIVLIEDNESKYRVQSLDGEICLHQPILYVKQPKLAPLEYHH